MTQNSKKQKQTVIPIPLNNKRDFFSLYLELLKDFPPLNKLRPAERTYVSLIMWYKDKYRNLDPDIRDELIFSMSNRKKINKELGILDTTAYNVLKNIRKKKVIIGTELISNLNINIEDAHQLIFNFKINK